MRITTILKSTLTVMVLGCLPLALAPASASAATATATFAVTATVQATCTVTASALAFGTYVPTASSTSNSTISVTCTNTTPYRVGLSKGLATGATLTNRSMTGLNGALLNYVLTTDANHSTNWGDVSDSDRVAGTGNGSAQTLTVYGLAAGGQYVAPDTYSDTITATIYY